MASKAEIVLNSIGPFTNVDVFVNGTRALHFEPTPTMPGTKYGDLTPYLNEGDNQVLLIISYVVQRRHEVPLRPPYVEAIGELRVFGCPPQPFQSLMNETPTTEGLKNQILFIVARQPRIYPFGPLPDASSLPFLLGQIWTSFVSTVIAPWYIPANFPRNTSPFSITKTPGSEEPPSIPPYPGG